MPFCNDILHACMQWLKIKQSCEKTCWGKNCNEVSMPKKCKILLLSIKVLLREKVSPDQYVNIALKAANIQLKWAFNTFTGYIMAIAFPDKLWSQYHSNIITCKGTVIFITSPLNMVWSVLQEAYQEDFNKSQTNQ